MTVFVYHALLLWSGCCIVSTLEDDTDADLTAGENIGASTLEDVTDAHLTAVGINDTEIVFDNKVSPPHECPPPYETPIVPQQSAGFYAQAGIPYQAASP